MTTALRPVFGWALVGVAASAMVSMFLSLQAGFFVLVFLGVAWWVWLNAEEGLLLFIVLAPLLPMLKITQTIGTVTLIKDVIILALLGRLVVWPLLNKSLPYRRNILLAPMLFLVSWVGLSTLRADSLILGVLRARDIVLYMLLYLAVLYLPHGRERMIVRMKWFVVSFLVVMALAVYQWYGAVDSAVLRFDPVREIWIPRLSSVLAHPSIFGEYLVTGATLFAALAYYGRERLRWWGGGLFALTLPAIFLTYSRAVWIGLVVAGAAMIAALSMAQLQTKISGVLKKGWLRRRGMLAALALGVVLIAVLWRFTPAGTFIRSVVDPTYGSNEERLEFLVRLIAPLSNTEALFGKGLGDVLAQNFREVDVTTYDIASGASRAVQLTKNRTLVDNQYLKTFVEMGLAGLLIYAWLFWRFGKGVWRLVKDNKVIGLWGVGFLAAFVVQGLFIDIWDIFPTNAAFWIVAALLSVVQVPFVDKENS